MTTATFTIDVHCATCDKTLAVPCAHEGKLIKCKGCGKGLRVAAAASLPGELELEAPRPRRRAFQHDRDDDDDGAPRERRAGRPRARPRPRPRSVPSSGGGVMNGGVAVGLLAMVGAVVWFFAGLAAGYIFFYPPVLFVMGVGGVIKGMAGGSSARRY